MRPPIPRFVRWTVVLAVIAALTVSVFQYWNTSQPVSGTAQSGWTQTEWGPLGPADRDVLIKVRQAGLWEMPTGQQAQQQGSSARVREVGGLLAAEHADLDQQVRKAAAQLGVLLPNQPSQQQQDWMAEIASQSGSDFDRVFVQRLRAAHGKVLPVLAAVRTGTRNDLVRSFVTTAAVFVTRHLEYLESTGLVDFSALPEPPLPAAAPPVASTPAEAAAAASALPASVAVPATGQGQQVSQAAQPATAGKASVYVAALVYIAALLAIVGLLALLGTAGLRARRTRGGSRQARTKPRAELGASRTQRTAPQEERAAPRDGSPAARDVRSTLREAARREAARREAARQEAARQEAARREAAPAPQERTLTPQESASAPQETVSALWEAMSAPQGAATAPQHHVATPRPTATTPHRAAVTPRGVPSRPRHAAQRW